MADEGSLGAVVGGRYSVVVRVERLGLMEGGVVIGRLEGLRNGKVVYGCQAKEENVCVW